MNKINELSTRAYIEMGNIKKHVAQKTKSVLSNERGASDLLTMILIIGIVLVLGFAFRKNLTELVADVWEKAFSDGSKLSDVDKTWD